MFYDAGFFGHISNISATSIAKSTTAEVGIKTEESKKFNFNTCIKNIANLILHPEAPTATNYSTLAIIALTCALFGVFIWRLPFELAALVFGIISLVQIQKTHEKGKGFAIVGVVVGGIYTLLVVLLLSLILGII